MVEGKVLSDRRGKKKICLRLKRVLCWIKATTWECAAKNQIQATKSPFTKLAATHQGLHVAQRPHTQKRSGNLSRSTESGQKAGQTSGKSEVSGKVGKGRSRASWERGELI